MGFDKNPSKIIRRQRGLNTNVPSVSLKRTLSLARTSVLEDKKRGSSLISLIKIIKLASHVDKLLLLLGCIFGLINGICWPLTNFFLAKCAQQISDVLTLRNLIEKITSMNSTCHLDGKNLTESEQKICNLSVEYEMGKYRLPNESKWTSEILEFAIPGVFVGFLSIITGYLFVFLLNFTAGRIILHMKKLFLKSLLKQDICWFDTRSQGELTSTIMRNLNLVQSSLGEKLGTFLMCISEAIVSLIFCFWSGWKLTLVLGSLYPILIVAGKFNVRFQMKMNKLIRFINAEVAGIVHEVLSAIRTVFAYEGEQVEQNRFATRLAVTRKMNVKQTLVAGMNFSFVLLITQLFIALGYWYGCVLIQDDDQYDVKDVFLIIFQVLVSGVFIRQAVPLLEIINAGFSASADVISVIERKPVIDSSGHDGIILKSLIGNIELSKVHFWFPSNPGEKRILRGLNLTISAGETVALVGPSGGGKSTILQLIQRFYDPQKGKIKVDGTPLTEFNVGWFRKTIGIVSQEPCLFNTTIRNNIQYGNQKATLEEIIRAAKEANAHDFIIKLPQQYDTVVGERGSLLSGGQRQRIAIARALVRNPVILLLDEATSALDNESEAIVQESLDQARQGRTTIIIAHRLSTIRNVDRIVAIKGGKVVEQGSHDELISKEGLYHQLLLAQNNGQLSHDFNAEEMEEEEEEEEMENEQQNVGSDMEDDDYDDYLESLTANQVEPEKQSKSEMRKLIWKILGFSKSDWYIVGANILFSALYAISHPARGIVFGYLSDLVVEKQFIANRNAIIFWPSIYAMVGFLAFVTVSIKIFAQSMAEENLLQRIRRKTLAAILKQEIGWFDEPSQNINSLSGMVSLDSENVKKIPGTLIGTWVYAGVAIVSMTAICFWYQWKLCLAVGVVSAGVFFGHYLKGKIVNGMFLNLMSTEDKANNLAVEAICNFRTVVSLNIQDRICCQYNDFLGEPRKLLDKEAQLRAMIVAVSDAMNLFGVTVCISYGAYLIYHEEASFSTLNVMNSLLINSFMEVSHVLAASPSYIKACTSAQKIFQLMARKPLIDSSPAAGIQLPKVLQPRIEFRDVCFAYPTRPNDQILKNINLVIENGQTVAFVGGSGCGKSTSMQLLQRLYDPTSGGISLNGYDIRCINVPSLRSTIGLVSQEPILFNRTIAENIAYGSNDREVCMHEIIDAAQKANIHEFISSLRQGYETRVGARGVQLSGGQKQRVAIARALIRNPKILLLDEATSALDNESEKIVQESLEKASEGRTCIVIAHRLSTIQNADKIVVFAQGQIVEEGTRDELFEKKGMYYEIHQIQIGQRKRLSRILL